MSKIPAEMETNVVGLPQRWQIFYGIPAEMYSRILDYYGASAPKSESNINEGCWKAIVVENRRQISHSLTPPP